ncbi:acetoacetate decarboxylase family protein [Flammeovirga agarivorans]|uniref:PKD domain-containing protein n=1 Tax=Flammeovirga agarivorans TaxID=2726742 RepID=A0A7X8SK94_9BACT|nr:acetoacetate decarboxylase family protein [Flammeovirga agarivorans]NLR91673.1 PKD domain-containing protein [Flammeovirga agarivorans]
MKNYILLLFTVLLFSCSKEEALENIAVADFDYTMEVMDNTAVVRLNNLSQHATEYQWTSDSILSQNTEEHPSITFTNNGTYTVTLEASNAHSSNVKSKTITIDTLFEHIPYRYLENDGIFMYYETDDVALYQSFIPKEFNMPSRMVVFSFFNDFYKLDHGAIPYKENAISILVEYQGQEFFHCIYMPVTDEHSMWAGILGLGLPKSLGDISFVNISPNYTGSAENILGGTMDMTVNTQNFSVTNDDKQEMIDLSLLRSIQIRNGKVIEIGKTGGNATSIIQLAEQFPNKMTLTFGEASIVTNTESISFKHPLDLTPSRIIGGYYLKNQIAFGLTGNPLK